MKDYHTSEYTKMNRLGRRRRLPIIRTILVIIAVFTVYHFLPYIPQRAPDNPPSTVRLRSETAHDSRQEEAGKNATDQSKPAKINFNQQFLARQPDVILGRRLLDVLRSQNAYGAFYLMVDGASGQILAWGQQSGFEPSDLPTFLPKSSFPAASLVKIVTAAAALESRRYSNDTMIPAIGSTVTLYRNQLKVSEKYKGRKVSLEKAFASSMNPSMGIIGLSLGGNLLKQAAERLGFNRRYPDGVPLRSSFNPPDTGFGVAEAASGFTTEITLSPLHAAAIVRAVLREDSPEIPWSPLVGHDYAPARPVRLPVSPLSENTYYGLKRMFEATIKSGSARTSFRNPGVLYSSNKKRLRIGGKTGTKDGDDGRYEWFAGYAEDRRNPEKSLVIVCLHINELKGQRASHPVQAAALLINHWSRNYLER